MTTKPVDPHGTGLLMVRKELTKTMCDGYKKSLTQLKLKPAKVDALAGGYEDGFRAAIASLIEMGVIVVQDPPQV